MAYQTLYRRYRPRRFSDVRGQDAVIRALRNSVRDERVGHAYLFSGPRGTGKTSTARILAKALNCEHLDAGEPDGTCESCLAIDAGTSYDVQELDAASNNKVEDIRDLIGRVALGSPGRTKVYILDEVHMLTPSASASLLKTLEEPPPHVVFVLATTDPQKVLDTIRSRTQHFEFHLLSAEELSEHVAWVIHDAGLDLPDSVIEHVVRQGRGSARDTLSALDQVSAAGGVLEESEALSDLLDAIAGADAGKALVAVSDAVSSGRDPRVLGEAVLARLRDIFLVRMGAAVGHLSAADVDQVRGWAAQLGDRATTRALEALGDALLEMRQAPDPRIPLEVAMVKLARVDLDPSLEALTARVARLEAELASLSDRPPPPVTAPGSEEGRSTGADSDEKRAGEDAPSPAPTPRPADIARAQLASHREARAATESSRDRRPAAATPPRPSQPSPTPSSDTAQSWSGPPNTHSSAASGAMSSQPPQPLRPAERGDESEGREGLGSAPADIASVNASSNEAGDQERFTSLWEQAVLPALGGLARAMYAPGRVVEVDGSTVVLALPNEVHRRKCERKRPEVERAWAASAGSPLTVRLVADEDPAGASADQPSPGGSGHDEASAADDVEFGGADVHALENATDAPKAGLDLLLETFDGAELVDET